MANNTYGIVRPALLNIRQDVDIFYNYRPRRNKETPDGSKFVKIDDPSRILSNSFVLTDDNSERDDRLPGMYSVNLPTNIFNKKGIYSLYIRPREIELTIKDIGTLAAYPDIKGIVIDLNDLSSDRSMFYNDNLVGYRVEYYEYVSTKQTRQDYYRIITSNNLCDIIPQNFATSSSDISTYRYTNTGSLCFITLTPSTTPNFKASLLPFIGNPNQKIILTNTKFDPFMMEIELTEHDIETVSYMLEGEQVRNLENGRITTYNFEGEVYNQFEYSTIKDNYTTNSIHEVKLNKKDNIDFSVDLNEIKKI